MLTNAWKYKISVPREPVQIPLEVPFADAMKDMNESVKSVLMSTNVLATQPYVKLEALV